MIVRLIRQDPAWGSLIFGLPIALSYGLVVRGAMGKGEGEGIFVFFALVYFTVTAWISIASNISSRCSRLALTLPLLPRRLWLLRIFSLLAVGALMLSAFAFATLWGFRPPAGDVDVESMRTMIWKLAAAQLLIPFLLQVPKPRLYKIPGDAWYVTYVLIVTLALALAVGMMPLGALSIASVLVISVSTALTTYLRLPRSLSYCQSELETEDTRPDDVRDTHSAASGIRRESIPAKVNPHWVAFRVLFHHWIGWVGFLSMLLFSMTLVISYFDGRSLTTQNAVMGLWLWALLSNGIARMYKVDSWPLSRRFFMAWTILPGLAAALFGAVLALGILALDDTPPRMVEYVHHELEIPLEFMEIESSGRPPVQVAPWGESHRPEALRPWPWSEAVVYNPFEVTTGQSLEFRAWQVERAVDRVHAESEAGSWKDNLDKSYKEDLERGSFKVRRSMNKGSATRNRTLAVTVIVGIVVLTLILSMGLSIYRGYTAQKGWIVPAIAIVVGSMFGLAFAADRLGFLSARALNAIPLILMRRAVETMNLPTWSLWALVAMAALLSYRLIEWQFARVEVSIAHRPKPAIQEW